MKHRTRIFSHAGALLALVLSSTLVAAQTLITPPPNSYSPAQDVELGLKAASEARHQLPVMHDDAVTSYVEDVGRRLVAAIPDTLRHPEFRYTFEVVNVREINAFALPGGPMFVNRGMIEAAHSEGEVAGVMAHELSHVVLRHGTAQASKATKYEMGQVAGAVIGSIIGGGWGRVVAQGTQFGIGTAFLRFSREFEQQADIEGSQIMARAGYDPRDMANMFKTIERQSGSGGPQWLSDHPNPGNRSEYIMREAESLQVDNPVRDTRGFDTVRAHLAQLPPAPTTEQATRNTRTGRSSGSGGRSSGVIRGQVDPPADTFRPYSFGRDITLSVPANWRPVEDNDLVTFAPAGAYGQYRGQTIFTHGMEVGFSRNNARDLQAATDELIASLSQANPQLGQPSGFDRISIGNRQGLRTQLTNTSQATGQRETIEIFTAQMPDGTLLYSIGVAPRDQFPIYRDVFERVVDSIEVNN